MPASKRSKWRRNKFYAKLPLVFPILLFVALTSTSNTKAEEATGDQSVNFSNSLMAAPNRALLRNKGSLYVPAFSSVRIEQGKTRLDLSITLSLHNSSATEPLVVDRIDYFDTSGKLVQRFLNTAIAIRPFGTIEVFIPRDDSRAGAGASFAVDWAAEGPIAEPAVDSLMIGSIGTNSYSFTMQGRAVRIDRQDVK